MLITAEISVQIRYVNSTDLKTPDFLILYFQVFLHIFIVLRWKTELWTNEGTTNERYLIAEKYIQVNFLFLMVEWWDFEWF